ncbi:MAG: hypothetical protein NWS47_01880 [Alphaproteobacteria bacterium]|nr:hypothetical protein [Alphaproteobacteria bacterium]
MLFILNKAIYCFLLLSWILLATSDANEIQQINETKYVGTKTIPYNEIDGSVRQDEVHFTFEKLNFRNLNFWGTYVENEGTQTSKRNREGLCAFETTLELFGKQELLNESQRESMHQFCKENQAALEHGDDRILQELDKFSEGSLYDIWIAYATRKNPRTEEVLQEDIEMVTSIFLSDAPIATPIGITRSSLYFSSEKKPHKNLAMQLHGFWAKASELIYGGKLYAVTYPTPHMYKIMGETLEGKEFGSLANGLYNNPSGLWSLTDPRRDKRIEFPQPDWFPPYEDGLRVTKGHSELSAHVVSGGNSRVVIDMRALIAFWDSSAITESAENNNL